MHNLFFLRAHTKFFSPLFAIASGSLILLLTVTVPIFAIPLGILWLCVPRLLYCMIEAPYINGPCIDLGYYFDPILHSLPNMDFGILRTLSEISGKKDLDFFQVYNFAFFSSLLLSGVTYMLQKASFMSIRSNDPEFIESLIYDFDNAFIGKNRFKLENKKVAITNPLTGTTVSYTAEQLIAECGRSGILPAYETDCREYRERERQIKLFREREEKRGERREPRKSASYNAAG